MYVTRPLSTYRKSPGSAGMSPPEGPNSGYLVLFDEESEEEVTSCCWGTCKTLSRISELPFPQNKFLTVTYSTTTNQESHTHWDKVLFVPVLDQPLSSNRYYVIWAEGKDIGKACTCSAEVEIGTCCFCLNYNYVNEVQPLPLNHMNIYQQVEIFPQSRRGSFVAKSVAQDGFPPNFLSRTGWTVSTSTPRDCELGEAYGVDVSLQMCLPNFNFPISNKRSSSTVVGKWYCPFMFIGEEGSLKDQMKKSLFYEMSMEQLWEKIDACENDGSQGNLVVVSVNVRKEVARLYGKEMVQEETSVIDGMRWFRPLKHEGGGGLGVGLSLAIVERMRWEEVRGGWVEGKEMDVKVERMEEFGGGDGGWKKFGCYVLVERFVLRRMDGSVVLTFDFRHTHRIQCKWE
ncbi:uncharacterized protein LOC143878129 [Tasmannia lanceolata]|uniref:uncharacterized protein LOC143878129 n=1 Tax=Tasmannia lanceolata TaxID=3420 RepID=UPI004063B8C6